MLNISVNDKKIYIKENVLQNKSNEQLFEEVVVIINIAMAYYKYVSKENNVFEKIREKLVNVSLEKLL
ncbi:MAG: hypothetical protein IJA34_10995 [Lachnospiraceae bacterium]|nr:hypothetical protein [Lachnospiraceae bacterium]